MKNPNDEPCPPDEIIGTITINAKLDSKTKTWSVYCPQWQCELHDKNLTRCVSVLVAEIETHNAGGPEDWNTFAAREGLPRLKPEAQPKKQPSSRRNWQREIPDDGTMTPNRNIYAF